MKFAKKDFLLILGGAGLKLYAMLLIAEVQLGQTHLAILTNIYLAIWTNTFGKKDFLLILEREEPA